MFESGMAFIRLLRHIGNRIMKSRHIVILIAFLSSCTDSNKKSSTQIISQLSGDWISVGFYKDNEPFYDTLHLKFTDRSDGSVSEMIHVIWTDSGTFEHVYSTDTSKLIRIDSVTELSITEFQFHNDSIGLALSYELDTVKIYEVDPKIYRESEEIKLIKTDSGAVLEFKYPNGVTYSTMIKELSNDHLILKFDEEITSRFKRLNMP